MKCEKREVSQVDEERSRWRQRERKGRETVPGRDITKGDQVTCGEANED